MENRAVKDEEENLRANFKHLLNWGSNIRPQGPEFDDDADIPPMETEDDEVLSAVTAAALVIDPAKRAPTWNILEITRERWAVIMVGIRSAEVRARLVENIEGAIMEHFKMYR